MNDAVIPPITESIENLFVVGINFKNADVTTRGKFFLGNSETVDARKIKFPQK